MSEACIRHCRMAMGLPEDYWSLNSIIQNIFVFRCKEITELLSCIMVLREFLRSHPQVIINSETYPLWGLIIWPLIVTRQVKLVIVDSLAYHFRHDLENAGLRSRVLHKIASQLTGLAVEHKIAVWEPIKILEVISDVTYILLLLNLGSGSEPNDH